MKYIIEVEGNTLDDIETAINEAARHIIDGMVEGTASEETGNYSFRKVKE